MISKYFRVCCYFLVLFWFYYEVGKFNILNLNKVYNIKVLFSLKFLDSLIL